MVTSILLFLIGYQIAWDQLYYVILGKNIDSVNLASNIYHSLLYISTLSTMAAFVGHHIKKRVIRHYFDLKFNIPITSEWDNILSGRMFEYTETTEIEKLYKKSIKGIEKILNNLPADKKIDRKQIERESGKELDKVKKAMIRSAKVNYTEVDALVNAGGTTMIYKGIVHKYFLGKDDTLDKLILKHPFRKKFSEILDPGSEKETSQQTKKFQEFESKYLVLQYSEIKNLNIRYVCAEKESDFIFLEQNQNNESVQFQN